MPPPQDADRPTIVPPQTDPHIDSVAMFGGASRPIGVESLQASELPGQFIGPYKLLELIGEGGFGYVWLAERRETFSHRVAIKVIKPGMDSKSVIARFEQERQTLAVMDHPNVARVLDGGITPNGRPYFVMEHVKGEAITRFCDRQRLTLRQRLALFVPVCDAVQHAHMKGIIHRDLKPGNVLVAEKDGVAIPKVIDFGVAKAVSHTLTQETVFTEQGQLIGTPEYMSPEQAEMGSLDIDTRTDVYSLGVMLYELLAGVLPFDGRSLRAAGVAEIQRIIRDVEAPKPSTQLSTADDKTGADIAKARQADRERIATELRRELEWIPLKAIRKDRSRRYGSAAHLARDVQRYLDGEALEAGPESTGYRVRKFVRRNRAQVTAVGAVVVALVAGMVGTGLALRRAWTAEHGLRTQLTATQMAQQAEKERAEQLEKVSNFQSRMLGQIDTKTAGEGLMADVRERFSAALEKAGVPAAERTARVQALRQELVSMNATDTAAAMIDRTILKPAIRTIDEQFKDDPRTDASLRQALADLYRTIGLFHAALPLQESALATRRRVLGDEHPDTLVSMNNLGRVRRHLGQFVEAESSIRETLEKRRRVLGVEHPETLVTSNLLGLILFHLGRFDEAEQYYRDTLEIRRRILGEEHPDTLVSIENIATLLKAQDKLAESEPYYREALEKRRRVLGEEHPETLQSLNNLGHMLMTQGRLDQAEPYLREALEKRRRVSGEEHPDTLSTILNFGHLLRLQGRFDEAEPYFRENLEKARRTLGGEHSLTLTALHNLGYLLREQGRSDEAEPYLREALEKRRRTLGGEHLETIKSSHQLGLLLRERRRPAEAEPYLREAFEHSRRVLGDEHAVTLSTLSAMALLQIDQGRFQEALRLITIAEPTARKKFIDRDPPQLANVLLALGRARTGVGFDPMGFSLAESNLLEAHKIYLDAKVRGPMHKDTLDCVQALVDLYTAWDQAEPAKGYDAKATAWKAHFDADGSR